MNRSAPPTTTSSGQPSSSQTMENQMVQKFSQQSGMNIEY